ncbi:AP-2 complex subunit alpha-2 [Cichlidogyrus casuarinus]|uniref:AP-2 complex subunit alpha-2 n=1 Tax=Cichlidogyrus casuarinus TaxID=1844966 RepID=A0ABD2Q425_9PLAT
METETVKQRLIAFGLSMLDGVDSMACNFTCAGVVQLTNLQVGVLVRIETALEQKKYRLTVLSTKQAIAKQICCLLQQNL